MALAGRENLLRTLNIFAFFAVVTAFTFAIMHSTEPEPYMDEIFHITQAQSYCAGNFTEWDPMITTLPGLYLLSVGMYVPVARLLSLDSPSQLCETHHLRLINVLFCFGNVYLLTALTRRIHKENADGLAAILSGITLASLPVLYFFTFLYYTDAGSTFFVLLTLLLHLDELDVMSSMSGLIAVVFRQTNIVWVFFVAVLAARRVLVRQMLARNAALSPATLGLVDIGHHLARGRWLAFVAEAAAHCWSYAIVGAWFLAFVYYNGGVVVGDRSHHVAVAHVAQLGYFVSFATLVGLPHFVNPSKLLGFVRVCWHQLHVVLLSGGFLTLGVWLFTYTHPYLLADNRHYTFYVWSRIIHATWWMKFALVPAYVYGFWTLHDSVSHLDVVWRFLYLLCAVVSTVPQRLLEFRYFILPYLILRLYIQRPSTRVVLLELLLHCVANAVTVYLFIERPFHWQGNSKPQRFMW